MQKDSFEKKYMEKSWSKEKHQPYKSNKIDNSIKDFYNFLKSKKVFGSLLDIGCGNGKNTIFFQKKEFHSVAIDFAKTAIDICKKNAKSEKVNPKFEVASVLSYKSTREFDVIIDCGCLHHIRRSYWNQYKKTILNNLKFGGYFYIHGISNGEANKKLPKHPKKRNWIINKKGHYTTFFSYNDIKKLLGNEFRIEKHYEFKSQNSPLTVRTFYAKKLK